MRTFARQISNVMPSDTYDDLLSMASAESAANIEEDLNYARTQLKVVSGRTNWFDPLADNFDLTAIHDKLFTYLIVKTDDVTVGAGNNFVSLTGASKPTDNIAFTVGSLGGICAQLTGTIGSNDLLATGGNGNLIPIRDAATNDPIHTSGGDQIWGLLQVGNLATNGNTFGDAGNDQAQMSFVYINPTTEAVTACPIVDIAAKVIEYSYRKRVDFYNLPESAFDPSLTYVENVSLGTLDIQDAYNNSATGNILLSAAKNITVDLNSNADFEVKDGVASYILADQSLAALRFGVDVDILNGKKVKHYDVGSSNYVGFAAPPLTVNQDYVLPTGLPTVDGEVLSGTTGGVLSWVSNAANNGRATYVITTNIAADTSINISAFTNPHGVDFGVTGSDFVNNFIIIHNGDILLNGVNAAANNDVYWVDANNIAFEFNLIGAGARKDILQIIKLK